MLGFTQYCTLYGFVLIVKTGGFGQRNKLTVNLYPQGFNLIER